MTIIRKSPYRSVSSWRMALLAATVFGLHGCMSSPVDQLSSIEAQQKVATPRPINADQASLEASTETESEIAAQANADVAALISEGDDSAGDSQPVTVIQPQNIEATKSSIFANSDSSAKQPRLGANQQVAAVNGSIYASQTVEAAIAADEQSRQPGTDSAVPDYATLARNIQVPTPDARDVAQVQQLAMADETIPSLNVIDSAENVPAATPDVVAHATANQLIASADPAAADMQQASMVDPSTQPLAVAEEPQRRSLTLADLFRKKPSAFDKKRLADRNSRKRAIPNMQTAALGADSLPGVNAMFPTTTDLSPDGLDDSDDGPAGLMKLASLPSMTRIAPNGLFIQTDEVEVSCLRPELINMIKIVENHYKRPAIITSGYRDFRHNRRAGGAQHSLHTICAAADIQVQGVSKWTLAEYLRSLPGRGGVGTYCHTDSVHIDIGGERDWNWRCRRRRG